MQLTKENKVVDVRLTYDKGLDRYYGLLDLALKHNIFKSVSTRVDCLMVVKHLVKQ